MKLGEDIKSITDLKKHPAMLLREVNKHRRPLIITQKGQATVVVQDIASFEATRKALLLLKLMVQGETAIQNKKFISQADLFSQINKKFAR